MRSEDPAQTHTSPGPGRAALARDVGLLGATALVVVNMAGSSVYTLPASIAKAAGPLGIAAWILTALGYLFVAIVYARLGTRHPRTGGPYAYARAAFGDTAGFVTVWCYWLSATIGNAAIVQSAVGYVPDLWPALAGNAPLQFALAVALVWLLCLVNVLGVKHGVRLQTAILVIGLAPLLVVAALGLGAFDASNLEPFAPEGVGALPAAMALVVWAYSGVESAAVPAEEVRDPGRTIARATYLGYALGTVVFLALALGVHGALANASVVESTRPLALLAETTGGPTLALVVSATAILACLGTLNGWLLLAGRIPVAAAEDGLFPAALGRIHPRFRTPAFGLVVAAAIATGMLCLLLFEEFLDAFDFVVYLALVLTLVPHLLAAAADWRLASGAGRVAPTLAIAFVVFAIAGCGAEAMGWSALLVVFGIVLHVARARRASRG